MLTAVRTSQDEVHVICPNCDYLRAVPLTVDAQYDGIGHCVRVGKCGEHGYGEVLKQPVPGWKGGRQTA